MTSTAISSADPIPEQIARALRSPFVPAALRELGTVPGYLDAVWPQLEPSVATSGFLGSALYMADMALDGVEEVYEPLLSRRSLLDGALEPAELERVEAVLDVFHWLQPQLLLLGSAMAEAWDRPRVGGHGRPDPREQSEREAAHLATAIELAAADAAPLPEVVEELQLNAPPDLYCALSQWPAYLEPVWDELQHLVAYPHFRRRGRALYFYARGAARFLARPLEASREELLERGLSEAALDRAHEVIEEALPVLATMMMHCTAMRLGLGITTREVVQQD